MAAFAAGWAMVGHEAMRRIDRWFGVPACAALSGMRRVARRWRNGMRALFVQIYRPYPDVPLWAELPRHARPPGALAYLLRGA